MLASILNSEQAVKVSILIIKTFVRLRKCISEHKKLAEKLNLLEQKIEKHDEEIRTIFEAIRQLIMPPSSPRRKIGFHP